MAQQKYGIGTGTIFARGNNGERPVRTAGQRARSDGPLLPMNRPTFLSRWFGAK